MNTRESTGTFAGVRAARAAYPPDLVIRTPLRHNEELSLEHGIPLRLKLENEQTVRSYKVRGAAWRLLSLPHGLLRRGVVCASAGNHAQGVATCCNLLGIEGTVFMPCSTPRQKIDATKRRGNGHVTIRVEGTCFDETAERARTFTDEHGATLIHPFDDWRIIEGQGTVALEIMEEMERLRRKLAAVIVPVGGGGLLAGTVLALRNHPDIAIYGVEPEGAACMAASVHAGHPVKLESVDAFVDGAAVAQPGDRPFEVVQEAVSGGRVKLLTVSNSRVCDSIAHLFQIDGVLAEPAGALSVAALEQVGPQVRREGDIVSIISGGNLDMRRIAAILEQAELYRTSLHECLRPV
jgi:threonine dehydratase